MSKKEDCIPSPENDKPSECQPDIECIGKEVMRLYELALAFNVPTVVETSEVRIVITPKVQTKA